MKTLLVLLLAFIASSNTISPPTKFYRAWCEHPDHGLANHNIWCGPARTTKTDANDDATEHGELGDSHKKTTLVCPDGEYSDVCNVCPR